MDLQVLNGNNPEDTLTWEDLVNRAPVPDVYYRPGYVRAYALTGEGHPVAVVVFSGPTEALFPLLIRQFEIDGEVIRDAITPYGYGGLLRLAGPEHPHPQVAREVFRQLLDWARASGLVACTIRCHPILNQDTSWGVTQMPEESTRIFPRGHTTAIRLQDYDVNRHSPSGMSKGRRYDLKRARTALRLRVSHGSSTEEDLKIFRVLYRESMERVQANEFFLFADEYYECLANELGEKFAVFTALADDRPVASAIFLADRMFHHYHLSASNEEGRLLGATTLQIVAASEWARQEGCSLLHLGGGLKTNDSLWVFKSSFGGKVFSYSYMTLIADVEPYEYLLRRPGAPWPYLDAHRPAEADGNGVTARPQSSASVADRLD